MTFFDIYHETSSALRANKVRSGLTMLGIVIGSVLMVCSLILLFRQSHRQLASFGKVFEQQAGLLGVLGSLLSGFKETKMHSGRAAGLSADFHHQSTVAADTMISSRALMADSINLSQILIFLMLGALVFAVPSLFPSESKTVASAATVVLFMVGPLNTVVNSLPTLSLANAAAEKVTAIEAALTEDARLPGSSAEPFGRFEDISLKGVQFSYEDSDVHEKFGIGPIDLIFKAGETVFITGGNGSGKTTLLRLLVGLYRPSVGHVCVDDRIVDDVSLQAYRDLFTVVFADCHLFSRLYGIDSPSPVKIDAWMNTLGIQGKTEIKDGAFSTVELSSGQKKRIAFLVAMLEDRPVVVLDEWAADQDPQYRYIFYHRLIPDLTSAGKTVIAITHDDRYFNCADRCIEMSNGRILSDVRRALDV